MLYGSVARVRYYLLEVAMIFETEAKNLLLLVRQVGKVDLTGYEFLLLRQMVVDGGLTLEAIGTDEEELEKLHRRCTDLLSDEELARYILVMKTHSSEVVSREPAHFLLWLTTPELDQ